MRISAFYWRLSKWESSTTRCSEETPFHHGSHSKSARHAPLNLVNRLLRLSSQFIVITTTVSLANALTSPAQLHASPRGAILTQMQPACVFSSSYSADASTLGQGGPHRDSLGIGMTLGIETEAEVCVTRTVFLYMLFILKLL
jgi:hypothetical protein